LLRHGAKITSDKYGKTPMNDAAENEQLEVGGIHTQLIMYRSVGLTTDISI
jgi:hypothetical protein